PQRDAERRPGQRPQQAPCVVAVPGRPRVERHGERPRPRRAWLPGMRRQAPRDEPAPAPRRGLTPPRAFPSRVWGYPEGMGARTDIAGVSASTDHTDAGRSRFLNRELSWLQFNARVLALAEDPAVPLLERAKFLAIFSQNLDEFFQVRVAGLRGQLGPASGVGRSPDGMSPAEQLRAIGERVQALVRR